MTTIPAIHPRVSVHQVAFAGTPTAPFAAHCHTVGVRAMTLVTSLTTAQEAEAIPRGQPRVATLNHNLCPDLDAADATATDRLLEAVALAGSLGADHVYLLTGGRGPLTWEQAAERFAALVAPARATSTGVTLLVENASPFNADIHVAHTLSDTIALAELAGVGVCIDVHACWTEAGLGRLIARAAPLTGLVQVSDYVLGDRSAPCRAVPGDGAIPLRRILSDVLDTGYEGLFDIELVGPRIAEEGPAAATARAADYLSALLDELGCPR